MYIIISLIKLFNLKLVILYKNVYKVVKYIVYARSGKKNFLHIYNLISATLRINREIKCYQLFVS